MVAGRLLIGSPADQLLFFLLISDLWEFNLSFQYLATEGILSDILWPAKR